MMMPHQLDETMTNLEEPTSDVEFFAQEVLSQLFSDNVPPTPSNFQIYFDKALEKKSLALRQEIAEMTEFEDSSGAEQQIEFEKSLKHGFNNVKQILNHTGSFYKNISLMNKILTKKQRELETQTSPIIIKDIVTSLKGDMAKLDTILEKQGSTMKSLYQETLQTLKDIENNTVYDNQYGVYNKRYLLQKMEQEIYMIDKFSHKSTLVMLSLTKRIYDDDYTEKTIKLMTKTIARLLLKTSRRSDVITHYGEGVFALLLSHTDIQSAKKASERLFELVQGTNFFIGNKEVRLAIDIGLADIPKTRTIEESIVCALDALTQASAEANHFYICNNDDIY
jgi:diguanylate cyclase (GGDEF)-like protein